MAISIGVTSAGFADSAVATPADPGRTAVSAAHPPVGTITLVNPASGAVTARVHFGGFPDQLIVPRSGTAAFVTAYASDGIVAYKITPGKPVRVHRIAFNHAATALAISPDGRTLYAAQSQYPLGKQPQAKIVPVNTSTGSVGRPIVVRGLGADIAAMSVEPNGKVMYVAGTEPATLAAIRISERKIIGRPIHIGSRTAQFLGAPEMAYSRSGDRLYLLSDNTSLRYSLLTVINSGTNREIGSARVPGIVQTGGPDLAVTPSGSLAYVVSSEARPGETLNFVTVLHVGVKVSIVRTLSLGGATAVAEAPSGRAAYVAAADYAPPGGGSETGQLTAIPTATSKPSAPVTVAADTPIDVGISPGSDTAYVEEANDDVYPVNLTTDAVGSPIVAGPQPGYFLGGGGIAFTGNGHILYVLGTPTE